MYSIKKNLSKLIVENIDVNDCKNTNIQQTNNEKRYKHIKITSNVLIIIFTVMSCTLVKAEKIPFTNVEEKSLDLKLIEKKLVSRSLDQLIKEEASLNYYLGGYPPRFESEEMRDEIYGKWTELISDAEYYGKTSKDEKVLYLLADLYRQGHNMDVKGSGDLAIDNINLCLKKYPRSISCHFTSVYFNLSAGPAYLDKGKESLDFLRKHYGSNLNSDVESGYVHFYLFKRDNQKAKKQIKKFIKIFPKHRDTEFFKGILPALDNEIKYKKG